MKIVIYKCKPVSYTIDNVEHTTVLPYQFVKRATLLDLKGKKKRYETLKDVVVGDNESLCYTFSTNKRYIDKFVKKRLSLSNKDLDLFIKAVYPFYGFQNV